MSGPPLESSLHLFQRPRYRGGSGTWTFDCQAALRDAAAAGAPLSWDVGAILGMLGFGYACGDRTLAAEVRRQPWLSEALPGGEARLEPIPAHDGHWDSAERIAGRLQALLHEEMAAACRGRSEIYLLLSGGLDSRIAAAIAARAHDAGELPARPVAVTWGHEASRDVVYARAAAGALGLEWIHAPIGPATFLRNVEESAVRLAALVSPTHLHGMTWFESAPRDALVLAASYGDSVGRAEFSKRSLVELTPLRPPRFAPRLRGAALAAGRARIEEDLRALRDRAPGAPRHAVCEHEMNGHYLRGVIGHAMSLIGNWCDVYQVFTHPAVYRFVWSLHPALRDDAIYACLLERLHPRAARLPWARTGRALRGRTEGRVPGLRAKFHDYAGWVGGELHADLARAVDPEWFEATGLFDPAAVAALREKVRGDRESFRLTEIFAWLAAIRRFGDLAAAGGAPLRPDDRARPPCARTPPARPRAGVRYALREWLRHRPLVRRSYRALRRELLRRDSLRRIPRRPGLP